jgi:hypothetical protein
MNKEKEKPSLLQLLNSRTERAEKFTSDEFIQQVKRDVEAYEAKMPGINEILGKSGSNRLQSALNYRYDYVIPMVFTNTEAAKASLFERLPDLIIKCRGKDDDVKAMKINAVYEYLKDKLDLDTFAWTAAHWFILSGFTSATIGYKTETHKEKVYDEMTGEAMLDEMGEEVSQDAYDYDDPTIDVDNPMKTWFAPSSKFDVDAHNVDYKVWWDTLDPKYIKKEYGEEIDGNYEEEYSDSKDDDKVKGDSKKCKTYFYCGNLPEEVKDDVENYDEDSEYYVIFTTNKILYTEKKKRKTYKLCRWYANPNDFFGYGFGKIGAPFQKEKSTRVGQRIRLADVAAYPKYAVKNDGKNKIKPDQLKDPRENIILEYETDAPTILQPGNLSGVVTEAEQAAESDAQAAFGLLDISSGAQESSTVDTATGQTIFAEASQRRIKQAKRIFMKFYRACLIELFKQCQDNWDSEKIITLTDEDGNSEDIAVTRDDLKDIDFDKDVIIDAESVSVNKDVVREQMIALYDKVKDDPLIERKTIFKDMIRKGFEVSNPDRYIKENEIPVGTTLVNPSTGEQYTIDEGGELVSAVQTAEQAPSSPEGMMPQAPTQAGMSGGMAGSQF